jgi:hypothetical protein
MVTSVFTIEGDFIVASVGGPKKSLCYSSSKFLFFSFFGVNHIISGYKMSSVAILCSVVRGHLATLHVLFQLEILQME